MPQLLQLITILWGILYSFNTYTSTSWQNEIHTFNVFCWTIQMNKTPKLNLSWIKVVVSELLDNLFWNNMPGQLMKMRSSIKFQTWLGNNTQGSQIICHKNIIFDSIVSDFGYHEMFLSICHFFVWCSWQLTLCTVSIGFIVLRGLSTIVKQSSADITKFGLFYGYFFTQVQYMNFVFQSCLSGSLLNHEIMLSKTFFHIFLPLQLPIEFFYNVYSKKGDNKVELSYP